MSLFDRLWPKNADPHPTPALPKPGIIPAINYWRALQILKNTPFLELWAALKKEAPSYATVLVVIFVFVASFLFTVAWFIKKTVTLIWRALSGLFSLLVRK